MLISRTRSARSNCFRGEMIAYVARYKTANVHALKMTRIPKWVRQQYYKESRATK